MSLNINTTPWDYDENYLNYDNNSVQVELFRGYPTTLLHFAAFCCIVFMLVGIPGNLITVTALFKYKKVRMSKVRNATAVFIMNLSTSDLMFCCFNLPLAASLFYKRAWTHGELLCRLLPLMRYGLLAVSLFSILAITINRYVMIGHPRLYPKIYKQKYLACMIASMWLSGFGALVATWFGKWGRFGLDIDIGSCSIIPDENGHSPKQFLFVIAFVIPCIFILVCYARIFYIVRKTALKSRTAPRNNTVILTNNSTSTQKDENKSGQDKGFFQSNEDSALGTMSTGATLTDKSSLTTDKFQYINEGTSYLCDDPSSLGNVEATSGIEKSPLTAKKEYANLDYEIVNNNGTTNGNLKVRSNPNLLSLPEQKYGPAKNLNDSANNARNGRSYSEENIDLESKNVLDKVGKTSQKKLNTHQQLDKSFSLDQITENETSKQFSTSSHQPSPHKKQRRYSSLAIVNNMGNIFRRQTSNSFKPNNKFHTQNHQLSTTTSSLHHTPSTHNTPGKMTAKDKKILKMILVIFLSFVTCYLPITISKAYTLDSKIFNIMGYILIYLTPCINPLIYVVMSSEYRQAYKNLLMCKAYGSEGSGRST